MQEKISVFSLLAAIIVLAAKFLIEEADSEGNIYIKTPKEIFKETKIGAKRFVELFVKKNKKF